MSAPGFDPERFAPKLAPAGALLAVVGGCAGGGVGLLLAAVGVVLLLFACVSRRDGLLLLGPFARAELVRAARTRRPWLWRAIYALAAGAILVGNVWTYASESQFFGGRLLPISRLAYINTQVTNWFLVVLFGYVCVLTVQLMTSVVAEEREARRWDDLLVTNLRAREILLGKAVGRLPLILDPVLAALPVLALTPLLGGVSPVLMAWAAVAILAVVLGLSGVALFYSVFARTARAAITRTVGLAVVYLLGSGALCLVFQVPRLWHFPSSVGVISPVEVGDVFGAAVAGNPFAALGLASYRARVGPDGFEAEVARAVRRFAAFQVGVFALFGLTAVARLRRAVPWEARANAATVVRKWRARPTVERPPVGDMPVYWWQRYGSLSRAQLKAVTALTPRRYAVFGLESLAIFVGLRLTFSAWKDAQFLREIVPWVLWVVTLGIMIPPVFRAARSVARERAAGTLDDLRLTALTARDVLYEKWLGCVMSELPRVLILATVAAAAVLTGLLHPLSLVGLTVTLPVYCGSGAAIGLYFSVRAANPGRAGRNMILDSIAAWYGLAFLVATLASWLEALPAAAIGTPPAATALVLNADLFSSLEWMQGVVGVSVGVLLYAGIGWAAWRAAVRRFEREWSGG
ncbi:MAG TPA: ABC transporter permease subunit [Fimbriiglobus sp.]|nr:ABC transporter permease subunit [Fimbriiglobus sp.]